MESFGMYRDRIAIGDKVRIVVTENLIIQGQIDYVPCQPGDCFVVLDDQDEIVYIQNFLAMYKIKDRNTKSTIMDTDNYFGKELSVYQK